MLPTVVSYIRNSELALGTWRVPHAVALTSLQQRVPYIAIRALSDLAGRGSADSNEADTFLSLAADNSIIALLAFVKQLSIIRRSSV